MGKPAAQHMQPPATSRMNTFCLSIFCPFTKLPSTPISPNSLTNTAQRSSSGLFASKFKIADVFPTPRNPVIILVGTPKIG